MAFKPRQLSGEAITDEKVVINIADGALYYAWLDQMPDSAIAGNDSAEYGVYSAVLGGGTRYDVLISGNPTAADEVSIDIATGKIISTTEKTVYVTYRGYGSVPKLEELFLPVFYYIPISWGDTATEWIICNDLKAKFKAVALGVQVHQTAPTAQTDIYIRTDEAGGGVGDYVRLAALGMAGYREFTADLAFDIGDKLVVRCANGNGLAGITLAIYRYVL